MCENQKQAATKLTPEEMQSKREELIKWYKDQIPLLEVQAEYEELVASIEEFRLRSLGAITRQATLTPEPKEKSVDTK